MKKKLFIVSLVLSMCFSMLSIVNVQAKETIREDHYVNPIYKDVKSSVVHHDIQTYSLEDVEYTSDQEKLVKIFREKLINRESNIVLYYHCDEEITQEFFSNLVHQLFQKAIKHTGNGKEGDYLKWHCQGWTVKATISGNSNEGYDLNILYDVSVYGICWNKEGSISFYRNGRYIDGFGDSIQAIFPCSGQSACMEKSFCCRYYK